MGEQIKEYSHTFFLMPGDCNAQQHIPVTMLVSKIIEVATEHANSWGVGYATLITNNEAWVLSRVTIEMKRYPRVNEHYTLTTWVEAYNRHFSQRNFAISDDAGNEIGYARTVWVVINSTTRESVDISKFSYIINNISDRECPIDKQSKLRPVDSNRESKYRFRVTDIDFNRHVNSVRYVELLLNQWNLDFFDTHEIRRFEVAFIKECKYDMEVNLKINDSTLDSTSEIIYDGESLCRARISFCEENYKE
ncbi:MAG: thioesterase [Muribaculaceae bacterium]